MSQRHLIRLGYAALIALEFSLCAPAPAQTSLKKLRLGIAATSVGFLPKYAAHQKGFYKDEGIDLEIILMSLAAANIAFFKGEIEYSAGLTGLALAAARNYPAKVLIFTIAKPLQSFVSRRNIKEPRDLKGKKVAGSSPGGSATILAYQALKHFGLEPGKDVQVLPMGGSDAGRLAVLEQGVVDAALLSVPENILAVNKGYNELISLGGVVSFPQNGFSTTATRIQQQPDEVYRMVRATLRGLLFITDEANREQARDMMKQWGSATKSWPLKCSASSSAACQRRSDQSPTGAILQRFDPRNCECHAADLGGTGRRLQFSR